MWAKALWQESTHEQQALKEEPCDWGWVKEREHSTLESREVAEPNAGSTL